MESKGFYIRDMVVRRKRDRQTLTSINSSTPQYIYGPEEISGEFYSYDDIPLDHLGEITSAGVKIEKVNIMTSRPFAGRYKYEFIAASFDEGLVGVLAAPRFHYEELGRGIVESNKDKRIDFEF